MKTSTIWLTSTLFTPWFFPVFSCASVSLRKKTFPQPVRWALHHRHQDRARLQNYFEPRGKVKSSSGFSLSSWSTLMRVGLEVGWDFSIPSLRKLRGGGEHLFFWLMWEEKKPINTYEVLLFFWKEWGEFLKRLDFGGWGGICFCWVGALNCLGW